MIGLIATLFHSKSWQIESFDSKLFWDALRCYSRLMRITYDRFELRSCTFSVTEGIEVTNRWGSLGIRMLEIQTLDKALRPNLWRPSLWTAYFGTPNAITLNLKLWSQCSENPLTPNLILWGISSASCFYEVGEWLRVQLRDARQFSGVRELGLFSFEKVLFEEDSRTKHLLIVWEDALEGSRRKRSIKTFQNIPKLKTF